MPVTTYRNGKEGEPEVRYVGRVLSTHTRETRVMSDVYCDVTYATVIEDDGRTHSVGAIYHFELGYPARVVVDATDEAKALAAAYTAREAARVSKETAEAAVAKAKADIANPKGTYSVKRGDTVVAIRKVKGCPKGTTGEVFWVGACKFSGKPRVGFRNAGGTYWVNECSVEVPEALEKARAKAKAAAEVAKAKAEAALVEATAKVTETEAAYAAAA
jgi:hypothetical protein